MTYHIPFCLNCNKHEVTIVLDSDGNGFCSKACKLEVEREMAEYDRMVLDKQLARYYPSLSTN